MICTKYIGKFIRYVYNGFKAHVLIIFDYSSLYLAYYVCKDWIIRLNDITPSCVLSLNPVIKRLHKRWNWHVKSVVNAGTVLVLDLTLGALISCDVLVLTWIKGT
jgi:hypothetical protein